MPEFILSSKPWETSLLNQIILFEYRKIFASTFCTINNVTTPECLHLMDIVTIFLHHFKKSRQSTRKTLFLVKNDGSVYTKVIVSAFSNLRS